jgi:hypothetical protein
MTPKAAVKKKKGKILPALAGWREYVELPELGIGPFIAKLDTGARSAAIHAENIEVHHGMGRPRIRFEVRVDDNRQLVRRCELPLHDERRVKNTGGRSELRHVVETMIKVGNMSWRAQVTLTDRTDMGVTMLLGRTTIKDRFVVDPGHSFMLTGRSSAGKNAVRTKATR